MPTADVGGKIASSSRPTDAAPVRLTGIDGEIEVEALAAGGRLAEVEVDVRTLDRHADRVVAGRDVARGQAIRIAAAARSEDDPLVLTRDTRRHRSTGPPWLRLSLHGGVCRASRGRPCD